jgi:hypothetical protein
VANSSDEPVADAQVADGGADWGETAPDDRGDGGGDGDDGHASVQRRRPASLGGLLAGLASQAAVLTAVLFYFGWARERATFAYFGVDDLGVLNFSVAVYVLRSVSTALPLLMAIGFLAIGAFVVHGQLGLAVAKSKRLRLRMVWPLGAVGGVLVVTGFALALVLTGPGGSLPEGPALMVIGLLLASYALVIRDGGQARTGGRRRARGDGDARLIMVIWSLALIALLWSVAGYADYVGTQAARQLQAGLPGAANVVVYSSVDLSLTGPGVSESRISATDAEYHFRYSGLRLLVAANGDYFLLPSGWRPGAGSLIVLPETGGSAATLVEFQARLP